MAVTAAGAWVLTGGAWKRKGHSDRSSGAPVPMARPTGTGFYAIEDLAVGGDFMAAATKVASLAPDANGRRTLTLPPATYQANGFAMSSNYIGFLVPAGVSIVGSGPSQTIFQVAPDTITQAQVDQWVPPVDQFPSTNQLYVMVVQNGSNAKVSQLSIRGTRQRVGGTSAPTGFDSYTYNGLRVQNQTNPIMQDVLIKGIPGYRNSPPGETFGLNVYKGSGAKLYRVEADGRRDLDGQAVGAAGIGFNTTSNVYLEDCNSHHNGFSHGFAFWETNGIESLRCIAEHNGGVGGGNVGDGFNMERSRNSLHRSPSVGFNTFCELRYYARTDGDAYDGDTTGHEVRDLVLTDGGALDIRIDNAQVSFPTLTNCPAPVYSVN